MSYAFSSALQKAVYGRLAADSALAALLNGAIYDAPLPLDMVARPPEYLTIGAEEVEEHGSQTSAGALIKFAVEVHSASDGYLRAKTVAGAVCDALIDAELLLERGDLIFLTFVRARASAGAAPEKRKISLTFRAFIEEAA